MISIPKPTLTESAVSLYSPFINSSDNMCFEIHYQMKNGKLSVKMVSPGQDEIVLIGRRGMDIFDWERVVQVMPANPYYKLSIEAAPYQDTEPFFVAIDDISVNFCKLGEYQLRLHIKLFL